MRERPTAILGLGPAVFEILGVPDIRPRQLARMESFAGDVIDPAQVDADVLVLVDGSDARTGEQELQAVLRNLTELEVVWRAALVRDENEVVGGRALTRNVFGFTEGSANPTTMSKTEADGAALVGDGTGEPAWAVGGSYLALRVLRVSHDLWDADAIEQQEQIIGRRRDGRWLDGSEAREEPAFDADPLGEITPLDSHVRAQNPRDGSPAPVMLRRSWTWSVDDVTRGDGLLFMGFQGDLDAGFRRAQERFASDRLFHYTLATGGGYFFIPPSDTADVRWEDQVFR